MVGLDLGFRYLTGMGANNIPDGKPINMAVMMTL
jgi:hypothetical protein